MDRYHPSNNQRPSSNLPKPVAPQGKFSMNAVPPPSTLNSGWSVNPPNKPAAGVSKHGYSTMDAISQIANISQFTSIKRRAVTEDE